MEKEVKMRDAAQRSEYRKQWMKASRFRKWLMKNAGVDLARLTADDVDVLRREYDALPEVSGLKQTATLTRLIVRAERLVDECDYEMSAAIGLSVEIEHLLRDLYRGEVRFAFVMQSRSEQETVRGTLSGPVASYVRRRSSPHASVMQVAFYDVELCAWRSMHVGDFIGRVADEE